MAPQRSNEQGFWILPAMRKPYPVEELLSLGDGISVPGRGPAECAARRRPRVLPLGDRQSALGAGVLLAPSVPQARRLRDRDNQVTSGVSPQSNLVGLVRMAPEEAWGYWDCADAQRQKS